MFPATPQSASPIRVLVVDDSLVYRRIMARLVEGLPGVVLAGTSINGQACINFLEEAPVDLVLMDIEMPVMNGIETLAVIRQRYPQLSVVMVSAMNRQQADITVRALEAGALDFIPKPDGDSAEANAAEIRARLLPLMRLVSQRRRLNNLGTTNRPSVLNRPGSLPQSAPTAAPPKAQSPKAPPSFALPSSVRRSRPALIVVGVSTGGPTALGELIPNLPANLGVPVLVVQHMPPVFTASLADSLNRRSKLTVKEAADGDLLQPNTVFIAPGGYHMVLQPNNRLAMNQDPPENSCRPAVDVLFRSVAEVSTEPVLALIMTGMGSDGAKGVKALKDRGQCVCLTQREDTCVVYGMPKAVDDQRLSDHQVPLAEMAEMVMQLLSAPVPGLNAAGAAPSSQAPRRPVSP